MPGFTMIMSAPSAMSSSASRIASSRIGGIHLIGALVALQHRRLMPTASRNGP